MTAKATNQIIDRTFLERRAARASQYPKAKWITFCEAMLDRGYTVELYEARESVSKYITVFNLGRRFKVRFSNHGTHHRGRLEDCDFFVGVNRFGTSTTDQAIVATEQALGASPFAGNCERLLANASALSNRTIHGMAPEAR